MSNEFNIKKTGFKTPKNYFDSVENTVFEKLKKGEHSLQSVNEPGFKTPDGYFSSIEEKVFTKISNKPKVINLFPKKYIMYAASVAAAAIISFIILFNAESQTIEDLDTQFVENYIIDLDLSTYELSLLLSEEDINSLSINSFENALTGDTLETYLLENIDIETIIEQ